MTAKELLNDLKNRFKVSQKDYGSLIKKYGIPSEELNLIIENSKLDILNETLVKPLYQVFDENESIKLQKVLVDMIPCASINASSMKADNDEYLVVLNERLMAVIFSWHELQIHSTLKLSPESNTNDFSNNFKPILDCYLNPLSGNTLPIFDYEELSPQHQYIALIRTIMYEQFILAHELAHIYLGHVNQDRKQNLINDEFWVTFSAQNDLQQMEFDADIQAVKWLISLIEQESSINPLQNKIFFFIDVFTIFHLIECNIGFPTASSSHPSAIARLINIRDHYGCDIFSIDNYSIDDMIENFKDISSFRMF